MTVGLLILFASSALAFKVLPSIADEGYGEAVPALRTECEDLWALHEKDECVKIYTAQLSADGPKNCVVRPDSTCRAEQTCRRMMAAKDNLRDCTFDHIDDDAVCQYTCPPRTESVWSGLLSGLRYWLGRPLVMLGDYRAQK